MKRIIVIISSCLLFTAITCVHDDTDDRHSYIFFYNGSDYDVYINLSYCYPDTSLLHEQNVMTPGWNYSVESHSYNNEAFAQNTSYESMFISMIGKDTLIVFVYNADTLSVYGWDYVKDHIMVAQRYDLSLTDLQNLNWRLTFPPSEEMRNIKMWPPYGTYDEHGYRISQD